MRNTIARIAVIVLVFLLGQTRGVLSQTVSQTVKITADGTTVQRYPDSASDAIATVHAGSILQLIVALDDWFGILLPPEDAGGQRFGYVARRVAEVLTTQTGRHTRSIPTQISPPPTSDALPANPAPTGDRQAWRSAFKKGGYATLSIPFTRFQDKTIAQGYGIGTSIGTRSQRRSVDLGYQRTLHPFDGERLVINAGRETREPLKGNAVYQRIDVQIKRFWLPDAFAQPFLHVAVGLPWLTVTDAVKLDGTSGNLTFLGLGGDIGAGCALFAHPRVSMQISVLHRVDFFLGLRAGPAGWTQLEDPVIERGPKVTTALTFSF